LSGETLELYPNRFAAALWAMIYISASGCALYYLLTSLGFAPDLPWLVSEAIMWPLWLEVLILGLLAVGGIYLAVRPTRNLVRRDALATLLTTGVRGSSGEFYPWSLIEGLGPNGRGLVVISGDYELIIDDQCFADETILLAMSFIQKHAPSNMTDWMEEDAVGWQMSVCKCLDVDEHFFAHLDTPLDCG